MRNAVRVEGSLPASRRARRPEGSNDVWADTRSTSGATEPVVVPSSVDASDSGVAPRMKVATVGPAALPSVAMLTTSFRNSLPTCAHSRAARAPEMRKGVVLPAGGTHCEAGRVDDHAPLSSTIAAPPRIVHRGADADRPLGVPRRHSGPVDADRPPWVPRRHRGAGRGSTSARAGAGVEVHVRHEERADDTGEDRGDAVDDDVSVLGSRRRRGYELDRRIIAATRLMTTHLCWGRVDAAATTRTVRPCSNASTPRLRLGSSDLAPNISRRRTIHAVATASTRPASWPRRRHDPPCGHGVDTTRL